MSTALQTYFSEDTASMQEALEENLGGSLSLADLTRVKVPSGGAIMWEIPNGTEEPDYEKVIEGIIIAKNDIRVYYAQLAGVSEEKKAPDCQSRDGKHGIGMPGGSCDTCPMSQWGSARNGKGQACAAKMILYILRPGDFLPIAVTIPAGSLTNFRKLFVSLSKQRKTFWSVTVRLSLKKMTNGTQDYSQVIPVMALALDGDDLAQAKAYKESFAKMLDAAPIADESEDTGYVAPNGLTFPDDKAQSADTSALTF